MSDAAGEEERPKTQELPWRDDERVVIRSHLQLDRQASVARTTSDS
jgi:hypothetical protein